jgi:hypothetical protein
LDPIRSVEAFAVESNAVLNATRRVVTAVAVDVPAATNTTRVASPVAFDDLFASSIWKDGPFAVRHQEQVGNGTDTFASSLLQTASASRRLRDSYDIASSLWLDASRRSLDRLKDSYYFASSLLRDSSDLVAVACEQYSNSTSTDLFASSIWKDDPFAVTNREQVCNGTDTFASSLLQTASASRRLRDVMDDTKISTHDSVNNVLAWLANTLQAPRAASRYAITALAPKSSVSTRFLSPEILMVLSRQCPLLDQSEPTCGAVAMDDTKISTHDSVNDGGRPHCKESDRGYLVLPLFSLDPCLCLHPAILDRESLLHYPAVLDRGSLLLGFCTRQECVQFDSLGSIVGTCSCSQRRRR